jgi:Zn(2)-Cys(6) binuclear cluster domain-containing protein
MEPVQQAPSAEPMNLLSCQYCKKRKLRCDRRLPVCGRCTESNRECDYPGQRQTSLGKKTQMRDLEAKLGKDSSSTVNEISPFSHGSLEVMGDQVKDLAAKYDALLRHQAGAASIANDSQAALMSYQQLPGSDDGTVSSSEKTHAMSATLSPTSTYMDEQWTMPPSDTRQQL